MRETARRLILALYKVDMVYLAGERDKPVSDAEYCFMYALDDGRPHSQMEICREWLVPKTTINTIAKRWEREGLLTFTHVAGKGKELQIALTEAGKGYIKNNLAFMYQAEELALKETIAEYGDSFIAALETFGQRLKTAFESSSEVTQDGSDP